MSDKKMVEYGGQMVEVIDMTPTWEATVRVLMHVLETPKASTEGKKAAREEILRLARAMDKIIADQKKEDNAV